MSKYNKNDQIYKYNVKTNIKKKKLNLILFEF